MGKLANLPIGVSDFEALRREGYLYIDKTESIYNLITSGKYYFLSRPRRFGKSLLLSTLYNIFRGKKELFKGLYISRSDYPWEEYPVVRLDFNTISSQGPESLERDIKESLNKVLRDNGLKELAYDKSIQKFFEGVIEGIYRRYGKGVVFLVDEYDKPIIDHIGLGEQEIKIAEENRLVLKSFYGVLKSADANGWLRFIFITGVTKFSKVSIFSELNNLMDITMDKRYCDLLGITEEEMEAYLTPYIERFCQEEGLDCGKLKEELRNYYNGYRFSAKDVRVYNPFSLFSALEKRAIDNYWFETGTPTFLINLIKEQNIYIPDYEEYEVSSSQFSVYELRRLSALPLMFQTGYLTIKDYIREDDLYVLSYPNKEVKVSFTESLLTGLYLKQGAEAKYKKIRSRLNRGDIAGAIEIIKSIYSEIPFRDTL